MNKRLLSTYLGFCSQFPLTTTFFALVAMWGVVPAVSAQSAPSPKFSAASAEKKWNDLTAQEQNALRPLQSLWPSIGGERQRKWLEISKNYSNLTPSQQEALQARMTEWARLSPTERAQARLNFVDAKQASQSLTPEEKKAKWEAYQALSKEEKRRLAETRSPAKSTALAVTPVPAQKLTSLPTRNTHTHPLPQVRTPKIAVSPDQINRQTLLPQSAVSASKNQ